MSSGLRLQTHPSGFAVYRRPVQALNGAVKTSYFKCPWLLGLAAALFLALGPAVAPVLSASPKATIEICTAFGLVKQAVAGDFAAAGHEKQTHRDGSGHCMICSLRQLAVLPPSSPSLPVPSGFYVAAPVYADSPLAAQLSVLPYRSRAPPFSS